MAIDGSFNRPHEKKFAFGGVARRAVALTASIAFVAFLTGCVSDKPCWKPDFKERPKHEKKSDRK